MSTFDDLGLEPRVRRALADVGYEAPSPIQSATIPVLLDGRNVVGQAQTGTGKTAAFAVPILSRLNVAEDGERRRPGTKPQALVLAPTRELALQVSEAFARYASWLPDVRIVPVYGGQSYGPQLAALRRGADVVIGTPGRVIDHLNRGTLDLSELRFLVLDEADEMLQMGFAEDVETILADTPRDKQVALFSATMPPAIRRMAAQYVPDPVEVAIREETLTKTTIRQRYLAVRHHDKLDALTRILEVEPFAGVIIFVRTKSATEELAEKLRARGYDAAPINGDLPQQQRERVVAQLKSGSVDIVVATDVAARGLDVERISLVVNYDIPTDPEAYVHRIGRTGRAGRTGEALLFVTPREQGLLRMIEKATRQPIEQIQLPTSDDVNATRVARFVSDLGATLDKQRHSADFSVLHGLLAEYAVEHDVDPLDLAAALAVQTRDGEAFLFAEPERSVRPARERGDRAERGDRSDRSPRDRFDRDRKSAAGPKTERRRRQAGWVPYRIEVGKRHKVMPSAVVGALANEGGLSRDDFGHIDIKLDHTIVELPERLPQGAVEALEATRISGKLIHLSRLDERAGSARSGPRRMPTTPNTGAVAAEHRKPRHSQRRRPS